MEHHTLETIIILMMRDAMQFRVMLTIVKNTDVRVAEEDGEKSEALETIFSFVREFRRQRR